MSAAAADARVDLAHEPDFALGPMALSPSSCSVRVGASDERLEPRVMQVLVVLARADGATVTRDELVASCWEGRVVSDDAIARVIAKARNLARLSEPPAFAIQTIPKVGFRLTAGEAADTAGGADPNLPHAPRIWRRRPRALAALAALVLAAAAALAWWALSPRIPAHQNGRVEVMAFEPLDATPEMSRLAAAMGQGVMRNLSQAGIQTAPGLAPKTGAATDVEFRIAGTVDRQADLVVTSLQVLDPRSGVILWSTRHERPWGEARSLEDFVGAQTASVLQCMLEDRQAYPAAYDVEFLTQYLNGCAALLAGEHDRAVEFARRMVKRRPDLPGPHAIYAISLAHLAWETENQARAEALRLEARASARRALEIGPRYAEAHQAMAVTYPYGRDWAVREAHVLRVRELDPNFLFGHAYYTSILRETGRIRTAREVATGAARSADPRRGGSALYDMVQLIAEIEGPAAALATLAQVRDPGMARGLRRQLAIWHMPPAEGRAAIRELFEPYHAPAYRACIDRHLAVMTSRPSPGVRGLPPECDRLQYGWRIRMLARQGDLDGAFAEAARPVPAPAYTTIHFFQPEMKALRADPRFMPLAHRLGLVDYWRSTGRWPDFCAEPDLPYDCRAVAETLARAGPAVS
jgi:DNA-binding winged helix-turn-helix (wHTH) protein/TolB-like protein